MYFDRSDYQRARERHEQMLVEARILRLIRAAQAQPQQPQPVRQPQHRSEPLVARVLSMLRERRSLRA